MLTLKRHLDALHLKEHDHKNRVFSFLLLVFLNQRVTTNFFGGRITAREMNDKRFGLFPLLILESCTVFMGKKIPELV